MWEGRRQDSRVFGGRMGETLWGVDEISINRRARGATVRVAARG